MLFILAKLTLAPILAFGVTFIAVPESCQRQFDDIPRDRLREVIDWRPYVHHLRELGYDDARIRKTLNQNWWDPEHPADPNNLLLWAGLRDFDVADAIDRRIEAQSLISSRFDRSELKFLMERAPFWLDREDSQDLALRLMRRVDERDVVRLMLGAQSLLGADARATLDHELQSRVSRKMQSGPMKDGLPLLNLISLVPWTNIYPELRRELIQDWIDLDQSPPWHTDRIRTAGFGLRESGSCPKMAWGHVRSLGWLNPAMPDAGRRLVRVGGQLVGSVKGAFQGEPSMIALRNVIDSRGRLVLALGGVYQLPKHLVDDRANATIDVESLAVGPTEFLLNYFAWDVDNVRAVLGLVMDREVAEGLHSYIERSGRESPHLSWINTRAQYHHPVWAEIQRRIERFRRENERTDQVQGCSMRLVPQDRPESVRSKTSLVRARGSHEAQ